MLIKRNAGPDECYTVDTACPHCGGEPQLYPVQQFNRKRDAEKYKRAVEKSGWVAEIFIDERDP